MDFWAIGSFFWHQPIVNTYIPVENTIMKKPNILDEGNEGDYEFGYQYNNYDSKDKTRQKIHPFEQLSPMRGKLMGPGNPKFADHYILKSNGTFDKPPVVGRKRSSLTMKVL